MRAGLAVIAVLALSVTPVVAQGKTKAEIKAALVEEYGPRVLAEPADDGFQLTAWVVPVLAALAALALVIRGAAPAPRPPPTPAAAG